MRHFHNRANTRDLWSYEGFFIYAIPAVAQVSVKLTECGEITYRLFDVTRRNEFHAWLLDHPDLRNTVIEVTVGRCVFVACDAPCDLVQELAT